MATLAEMRLERETAADKAARLKETAARRWHALRVIVALALIALAYWMGYQAGIVEAMVRK